MGIYSISGNYSPLYSLSNGIFILWSFFTNLNILATKVGKKGSNPILGTWCGRGLKSCDIFWYVFWYRNQKNRLLLRFGTFFGTFFGTPRTKIFYFLIFSWYKPPCTKKIYFVFGTKTLTVTKMEEASDFEEFELIERDNEQDVTQHVSGSGIELKKLLNEGKTAEFFAAIGVERGYPEADQLALIKESSKWNKGNIFI
jgi:hypothetical protein